jgi:hypothetical protein
VLSDLTDTRTESVKPNSPENAEVWERANEFIRANSHIEDCKWAIIILKIWKRVTNAAPLMRRQSSLDKKKPSANEARILKQMDYLFSEANMRTDEVMKDLLGAHDGWIRIEDLAKLRRIAQLTGLWTKVRGALYFEPSKFVVRGEWVHPNDGSDIGEPPVDNSGNM